MLQSYVRCNVRRRRFIVEPKIRTKVAGTLTVRYYVDNLHPGRRKYADVMKEQQQ